MSCLDYSLGRQLITTLLAPQEVFLLQHKVFREYGKVAVGPDFVHTFPSFMIIAALFILSQRELNVKYLKISNKILETIIQIFINWIIINAGLWYWLIFQRIIYCSIWSYWSHEIEIHQVHVPWWQRVWQSFYPPPASPSIISASFVSWMLSMIISGIILHCFMHIRNLTRKFQCLISPLAEHFKWELKNMLINGQWEIDALSCCQDDGTNAEAADKSERGSFCDECHSDISAEYLLDQTQIPQNPHSTSWKDPAIFHTDAQNKNAKIINYTNECQEMQNGTSPQQIRNRRSCHTVFER